MRDFIEDVVLPIVAGVVAMVLIICVICFIWYVTSYFDCKGFAKGTGYQTKFEWGCYANVNGKWMPQQYVYGSAHELRMKDKKD
jgi:hypothetical protein